ncbi:unnamed protein product [Adineta ricciae]|uniref:Uncharacterized protein n=1 Tax=Adineta ricciae TaxID=249248 RepID=A0A813VEM0_ADIRI|nr:unnamed protein product [Adineta ricciae]
MIVILILLIQIELIFTKDPEYIRDYFHLISTTEKPLPLRKYYGMHHSSIDFYPGTMNVILSVPHDGDLRSNLPSRPKGACRKLNSSNRKCYYQNPCLSPQFQMDTKHCKISRGRDVNTRLLALALRYEFKALFHFTPYVIINRLERTKVDMNRFIDQGTFYRKDNMHAWMRYHFYLRHARELIVKNKNNYGGKGLLLDLHSHDHPERWVELGYLLPSRQLSRKSYHLKHSSFASYLTSLFEPIHLVSGNKSLGHFITKYNYSATPSPTFPSPPEQSYYEWGYIIEEYGRYGNFSAIMIESPARNMMNLTKLYKYAKSLACALHEYLIAIEVFEALVTSKNLEQSQITKQCNSSRQISPQRNLYLLLFFSVMSFI